MENVPLIIERGEGVFLYDTDGKKYYDGSASVWVNVHGHNVPELNQAIEDQLNKVAHSTLLGMSNVPAIELAEKLIEIAPTGLQRVFFTDNGAGAVEAAIKMAVQYFANQGNSKKKFIAGFHNNYHGDTMGAVSVAPDSTFHWPYLGMIQNNPRVAYPHPYRGVSKEKSIHELKTLLENQHDELAAVIVEPVEGAGGIIVPPHGFLHSVRQLCTHYDVLMIVDEVATGFGRTGMMFACDEEDVTPDLLCLGKGISGGYLPIAATLATEKIFQEFLGAPESLKTFFHGHSYTGNPLGAAVSLKSLELLRKMIHGFPEKIEFISEKLKSFSSLRFVGDVRHKGFLIGIELVKQKESGLGFEYASQVGWKIAAIAKRKGLLFRPVGNVLMLVPPLASTTGELGEMLRILFESIIEGEQIMEGAA